MLEGFACNEMGRGVSEVSFLLAYEGSAVDDGEMEVEDLAPALMNLARLLNASAKVVDGEKAKVSVKVQTTQQGSFEIVLSLAMEGLSAGWAWWKGDDVQAAAALIGLLGFTGVGTSVGLLKFLRFLRGRTPKEAKRLEDGMVEVTIENNVTIVLPIAVYHLSTDPLVRQAIEGVIAEPLERDGITSVRFGPKGTGPVVSEDEAYAFRAPLSIEDDLFVNRYRRAFSIVSLSFKDGQKWRLNDGHGAKYVAMSDEEFQDRVNRNEVRFAKGDILICEVIERSSRGPKGLKAEYEIVKVLEHEAAPTQPPLPYEG